MGVVVGGASSPGETYGAQTSGDGSEETVGGRAFTQGTGHGQTPPGGEGEGAQVKGGGRGMPCSNTRVGHIVGQGVQVKTGGVVGYQD